MQIEMIRHEHIGMFHVPNDGSRLEVCGTQTVQNAVGCLAIALNMVNRLSLLQHLLLLLYMHMDIVVVNGRSIGVERGSVKGWCLKLEMMLWLWKWLWLLFLLCR